MAKIKIRIFAGCIVGIGVGFMLPAILKSAEPLVPTPSISASPSETVNEGDVIALAGSNFLPSSMVYFTNGSADVAGSVVSINDGGTQILARVPAGFFGCEHQVYVKSGEAKSSKRAISISDWVVSSWYPSDDTSCKLVGDPNFDGIRRRTVVDGNSCVNPTNTPAGFGSHQESCNVNPELSATHSITPAFGPPGTEITVQGSYFYKDTAVTINGIAQPVISRTLSELKFRVADTTPTCSSVLTLVTNAGSVSSTAFVVTPAITAVTALDVSPDRGQPGTVVKVASSSVNAFGASRDSVKLTFGNMLGTTAGSGQVATAEFFDITKQWNANEIYPLVPLGAGSGALRVYVCGGGAYAESSSVFTVEHNPSIFYFEPRWGSDTMRTKVTIYGQELDTATVKIGGVIASVVESNPQKIVVSVPQGAVTGRIEICKNTICVQSKDVFYAQDMPSYQLTLGLPEISSISSYEFQQGKTVTLYGRNLRPSVWVGGSSVPATGNATQITLSLPAHPEPPILICNSNGCASDHFMHEYSNYDSWEVTKPLFTNMCSGGLVEEEDSSKICAPRSVSSTGCQADNPEPQLFSITPAQAQVGKPITITGCHFGSSIHKGYVLFGDTRQADIESWGDGEIKVYVPFDAVHSKLSVVAWTGLQGYAGQSSSVFDVIPTIARISPPVAMQGQMIDILGSDFCASSVDCKFGEVLFSVYPDLGLLGKKGKVFSWNNRRIRVMVPYGNGDDNGDIQDGVFSGPVKIIRSDGVASYVPEITMLNKDGGIDFDRLEANAHIIRIAPQLIDIIPSKIEIPKKNKMTLVTTGVMGDKNIISKMKQKEKQWPRVELLRTDLSKSTTQGENGKYQETRVTAFVPSYVRPGKSWVVLTNWDNSFSAFRPSVFGDEAKGVMLGGASVYSDDKTSIITTVSSDFGKTGFVFGKIWLPSVTVASATIRPESVNLDTTVRKDGLYLFRVTTSVVEASEGRFKNMFSFTKFGNEIWSSVVDIRQTVSSTASSLPQLSSFVYTMSKRYQVCPVGGEGRCYLSMPGFGVDGQIAGQGYVRYRPFVIEAAAPEIKSITQFVFSAAQKQVIVGVKGKYFYPSARVEIGNKKMVTSYVDGETLWAEVATDTLTKGYNALTVVNNDGKRSNRMGVVAR